MLNSPRVRFVLAAGILGSALVGFGVSGGEKGGEKGKGPEVLATLKGHSDAVYAVAFSEDGKYVATGSWDNTIKLWDIAGKELKTFGGTAGHQKMVLSVAISADGQFIASGSADNTLKVWDVPMSSPIRKLAAGDAVGAVALTADSTKLAVGTKDGLVKIVNAADANDLFKLEGHQGEVTGLTFSPNGQVLASSGADKTVRFWNVANGQNIAVVGAHTGPANGVAINPAGNQAFSVGDDGQLKAWAFPPAGTKALPAGHTANILTMAMSGDGNQIVTGGADKTVRQTLTAGKEIRTLTGPSANVISVALNAANTFVAAGTADERLFLWNAADGKLVTQSLAHAGAVNALSFHPQNTQLVTGGADGLIKIWAVPPVAARSLPHPEAVQVAVPTANKIITGGTDKILRVWDIAKLAVEKQFTGHPTPISAVAISGNGQILASGGSDGSIRFWNQAMGKEAETIFGHAGAVTALAINAGGTQLLSASEDGTIKVWQLPVAGPKALTHPDQVTSLALTADGAKVVTAGFDKQAHLWNVGNGQKEKDYAGPALPLTSVALSTDGKIAGGSADKTVHIWALGDAKVLQKIPMPAAVQAVAFSPDAKAVAAGLADNSIKIVNPADGKEIKALTVHKGAVNALAYTSKGETLFSGSADKTIQSWAMPDGAPKAKFDHVGPVQHLTLSKDGTRLAAVADKTVKIWNVADGKEVANIATPAEARGVGFSPDNARVVVAGADKLARIYEATGQFVESFPHDGPVHAVLFVDAKRIVSASADKQARIWTSALVWQRVHEKPVRQAILSPKGDQVLSAGDDKTVKIWNAADGKDMRSIAAHEEAIPGLSLSGDGTKLATTAADKLVKIWDLAAKAGKPEETKPVVVFTLPAPAQSLALSPNGSRIAVGISDGKSNLIRVYDIPTRSEIQVLAEHGGPIKSLQFLGDNRTLLTASADKSARLLDVGVVGAFEAHKEGVVAAQFHSNGNLLLTAGGDKTIKLWDLTKNALVKTFGPLPEAIKFATFNRDFTQIGAATGKAVKVWNIGDGKDVLTLPHPVDVLSLSFSVDKAKIATGAADKVTRVFDVATSKELQFFPQDDAVSSVVFSPANTTLVSAGGKTPRFDTLAIVRVIPADAGPVYSLAVTPPGTHVLTAGADKSVKMWNLASGKDERTFAGATATVRSVTIAKNGLLVAAAGDDQIVRVYNFADGKELGSAKAGAAVKSLAFTANNLALVGTCADKTIQAWGTNFTAGQPTPQDFMGPVQKFTAPEVGQDIAIAADSATIYTGNADKTVYVWKLASPAPTRNFPHPNHVDAVAFQPNGPLIASGGHDGKVRLFDNVKGAVVKEIDAHKTANATMIYAIAFSADGKQIASASFDQSVKLWDVATGALVREFKAYKVKDFEKGRQEPVFAVALSPDGKFLASGSAGFERIIKIWNTADGSVVRELANPNIKATTGFPAQSHPGWVYNMRWTKDGKYLVSVGDAPGNKGFLAVWNPMDGKMLFGETMPLGAFFGLSITADGRTLAIGAGPFGRAAPEFNSAYLIKMPVGP